MSTISQEQPLMAYPNTVAGQQQQPNPSHSNGSFGTVFIVLAVIIVISAIACFLGRLCTRKFHNQKPKANHKQTKPQKIQPDSHKFRIRPKEEDIELGFDMMKSTKGGGMEFGFDNKRNPKEVGIDKKINPRDGGIELGFDKRLTRAGANKSGGGEPKGSAFGPQ